MSDNKEIPSEYRISEKWDKCLENFTLYFGAGLVAGGLTSLVLART
jgi:inner membrane organizing system protein 1